MSKEYEVLETSDLNSINGGRYIVDHMYQTDMGMVPIYNTDVATARGLVDGFIGIFRGLGH